MLKFLYRLSLKICIDFLISELVFINVLFLFILPSSLGILTIQDNPFVVFRITVFKSQIQATGLLYTFLSTFQGVIFGELISGGLCCQYLRIQDFKIYYHINRLSISQANKSVLKPKSLSFFFKTYLKAFRYFFMS